MTLKVDVLDARTLVVLGSVSHLRWTQYRQMLTAPFPPDAVVRGTYRELCAVLGADEKDWPDVRVIIIHAGGPGYHTR